MLEVNIRKPLLLVDLNGTLCYRTKASIPGKKYDLYIRRKYIYLRPDAKSFLNALKTYYNVCIYSSVMRHNIEAVLNLIDYENYICKVFDQDYCKLDKEGINTWDTIHDMEKVFNVMNSSFSYENTILLDNETRKFQECINNGILVPEYGISQCKYQEKSLKVLCSYLEKLGKEYKENPFDVREYMGDNPIDDKIFSTITCSTLKSKKDENDKKEKEKKKQEKENDKEEKKYDKEEKENDKEIDKAEEKPKEIDDKFISSVKQMTLNIEEKINEEKMYEQKLHEEKLHEVKIHEEKMQEKKLHDEEKENSVFYIKKYAGESMHFESLYENKMKYVGFHDILVTFNVSNELDISAKMNLQTLWKSIEKASPSLAVGEKAEEMRESKG